MKTKICILITIGLLVLSSINIISASSDDGSELEVTKTVYDKDSSKWVDEIDAFVGEIVRFRLKVKYIFNEDTDAPYNSIKLTDAIVSDGLPQGFDYAGNAVITYNLEEYSGESNIDTNVIIWKITEDYGIELYGGESVIIEFDATAIGTGQQINHARARGIEICDYEELRGYDEVVVNIFENVPDTDFNKTVLNSNSEWVDEIEASVGEELTFKLEFNYYEDEPLNSIQIFDLLPCNLEFTGDWSSNVDTSLEVSNNGKKLTFNINNNPVVYGDTIIITFDAVVLIDECNDYIVTNIGVVREVVGNSDDVDDGSYLSFNDTARVIILDTTPPETTCQMKGEIGGNGWYTSRVSIYLSAKDDISGVNNTYYSINGGVFKIYERPFKIADNGIFVVSYYSVDNVGNVETVKEATVKIDMDDPITKSNLPEDLTPIYSDPVAVLLSVSDNTSGVARTYYQIDFNGRWIAYEQPFKVTGSGWHTVMFYSVDNAGNIEAVNSATFVIRSGFVVNPKVTIER